MKYILFHYTWSFHVFLVFHLVLLVLLNCVQKNSVYVLYWETNLSMYLYFDFPLVLENKETRLLTLLNDTKDPRGSPSPFSDQKLRGILT